MSLKIQILSFVLVPSRYLIYLGVSVVSTSHAGFYHRMIYSWSFATAWIVLLIARVISAVFCNCSRWNRDHGPYLKYEMIWWRSGLHKYMRKLLEPAVEVILVKSDELTSGEWTPSGQLISSGDRNGLRNVLDAAIARRFFLANVFGKFWWREHVSWSWRGSDFWSLQMPPPLSFSPDFEVEWAYGDFFAKKIAKKKNLPLPLYKYSIFPTPFHHNKNL